MSEQSKMSTFEKLIRPFHPNKYELSLSRTNGSLPNFCAHYVDDDGYIDPYAIYLSYASLEERFNEVIGFSYWGVENATLSPNAATVTVVIRWDEGYVSSRVGASQIEVENNSRYGMAGAITDATRRAMFAFGFVQQFKNHNFKLLNLDECRTDTKAYPILTLELIDWESKIEQSKQKFQETVLTIPFDTFKEMCIKKGFGEPEGYMYEEHTKKALVYIAHALGVLKKKKG